MKHVDAHTATWMVVVVSAVVGYFRVTQRLTSAASDESAPFLITSLDLLLTSACCEAVVHHNVQSCSKLRQSCQLFTSLHHCDLLSMLSYDILVSGGPLARWERARTIFRPKAH